MGYAPVKSDPWKAKLKPRRRTFMLWPDSFWKRLVERAKDECALHAGQPHSCATVSPSCVEMIREVNQLLYG